MNHQKQQQFLLDKEISKNKYGKSAPPSAFLILYFFYIIIFNFLKIILLIK
jgi:hypothetical protein